MDVYQGLCSRSRAGCWEMQSNKTRPNSLGSERPRDGEWGVRQSRRFIQNSAHEPSEQLLLEVCGEQRAVGDVDIARWVFLRVRSVIWGTSGFLEVVLALF